MDALALLKRDHDEVKRMLATLDGTTERAVKTREEIFTRLRSELEVHEAIEEDIFYPAPQGPSEDEGHRLGGV